MPDFSLPPSQDETGQDNGIQADLQQIQSPSQPVIPQYLSRDQARQLLQAAKQKGIDPGMALKALTDQGHIVQGVNDQQYQQQLQMQQNNQNNSDNSQPTFQNGGIGGAIGNTIVGIGKGFGRQLNAISSPFIQGFSKLFGASDQAIQQGEQTNEQQFQAHGTAEKFGGGIADLATATGAGMAGEMLAPAALTSSLTGRAAVQAATQGLLGLGTTQGDLGQRTEAGLTQGAMGALGQIGAEKLIAPALAKMFPATFGSLVSKGINPEVNAAGKVFYKDIVPSVQKVDSNLTKEFGSFVDGVIERNPKAGISLEVSDMERLQKIAQQYKIKLPPTIQEAIDESITKNADFVANAKAFGEKGFALPKNVIAPKTVLSLQDAFDLNKALSPKGFNPVVQGFQSTIKQAISSSLNDEDSKLMQTFLDKWGPKKTLLSQFQNYFKTNASPELQDESINNIKTLLQGNNQGGSKLLSDFENEFLEPGALTDKVKAAQFIQKLPKAQQSKWTHFLKALGLIGVGTVLGEKAKQVVGSILP